MESFGWVETVIKRKKKETFVNLNPRDAQLQKKNITEIIINPHFDYSFLSLA